MRHDSQSFSEFFVKNRQRLEHYAYTYVRDRYAAEDIVVDSFMSFWRILPTLSEKVDASAYIFKIVKNRCLDYLKKQRETLHLGGQLTELEEWDLSMRISNLGSMESLDVYADEIRSIVSDVLDSMPEKTRHVFRLSREENATRAEIAEKMGISVKGVEFHITKILTALRHALKDFL